MGFPTFENWRELLPPKVRLNADDIAAQMQGFLGTEHHADGSHSDVTADSLDTGPITIVSDDWWIALERENAVGNRALLGRLTQADSAILLQVAGADAMAWGVQPASGPGREQQVHDGLTVLERIKLFGQGTVSADPPGILQDDPSLGLRYSVYAVTATGARTVWGFANFNPTEGGRGQLLILWNASTFTITFAHDATATAFMRLICPGGVNLVMPPISATIWIYDTDPAVLKWRCVGGTGAGSGGGGAGGMNLDYLGDYVAGPVYNDGDIVVASDGIAYLCVVDGTTTPPEPWPGVGIATAVGPPGPPGPQGPKGDPGTDGINAAIDATYWTVSGHPGLTNERALNSLVNGYVKSTVGEPSTVAVIPITDGGTGGTTAPQARTNLGLGTMAVQNADSVAITGGTISVSSLVSTGNALAVNFVASASVQIVAASSPSLYFFDSATNTRWLQASTGGGTLIFNSFNHDGSSLFGAASLSRTGNFTAGGDVSAVNVRASSNAFAATVLIVATNPTLYWMDETSNTRWRVWENSVDRGLYFTSYNFDGTGEAAGMGLAKSGNLTVAGNVSTPILIASNSVQIAATSTPALYFFDNSTNTRWVQASGSGGVLFFNSYNVDGTGGVVAAQLTRAGNLTVATVAGDGSALTNLNASSLASGIANPARLGTGTPNAGTVLYGDQTWRPLPTVAGFPSGLIVLNDGPCPPGWTRVGWDGAFLRVNASFGATGGSSSHAHGPGSLITAPHSHGGATGSVTVSVSGTTSNDGSHTHPYSGHVGGTTAGGAGSVQTADAGGSFQTLTPPHTHDFGADYSGTTGGAGAHTHSFSGSGSGTGGIAAEQVAITGATDTQSHLPPFIDIILCKKD